MLDSCPIFGLADYDLGELFLIPNISESCSNYEINPKSILSFSSNESQFLIISY